MGGSNPIRRILVADGTRTISETMMQALSESGFSTKCAHSGEQAIELARTFEPDLFISALIMHDITGIEAAREIHDFLPSCRVILISGRETALEPGPHTQRGDADFEILAGSPVPEVLLDRIASLK